MRTWLFDHPVVSCGFNHQTGELEFSVDDKCYQVSKDEAHVALAMFRSAREALDEWYPGSISPVPDVDPEVEREWAEVELKWREGHTVKPKRCPVIPDENPF